MQWCKKSVRFLTSTTSLPSLLIPTTHSPTGNWRGYIGCGGTLERSKAFERSKRHFDRKVKGNDLKVGDPVYLFNTTRTSKLESKLVPYYRILEQVTPVNYIIRNVRTGKTRKVHALNLRKANLEWRVPETLPDARNLQRAQLATPLSTVESSNDTNPYGNAEFLDSATYP